MIQPLIGKELQAQLRDRFNPEGSQLRNIQLRQLELLEYMDKVCKAHDIPYWLSSGTLIGAARHGGFIPWDDDVDVEMLYKDFKRLCKVLKDGRHPDIRLQHRRNDLFFFAPYGKLRDLHSVLHESRGNDTRYRYRGIYIDIFALEKSNSRILAGITRFVQKVLNKAAAIQTAWLAVPLSFLLYLLNRLLILAFTPVVRLLPGRKYRHVLGSGFLKPRYLDEIFPLEEMEFEGKRYPVPHDTDAHLRHIYGDWTRLPDLDRLHVHITKVELD